GRVDGGGPHPGPGRGLDLVAHEGEQGRDDHGGTRAGLPEKAGGDEVDGRLAPAGALHHQGPPAIGDQRLDRRPLVLAQRGLRTREGGEQLVGAGAQRGTVGGDGGGGG